MKDTKSLSYSQKNKVIIMSCVKPVKLAYNSFEPANGVKEASPVIFLHGVTSSKDYWLDIPQKVADATNRKVYAIDARNHGDSEWSDEFNFDINVIDLEHFIDEIKADKFILVGHSMGGITAMKTALKSPNKIEKLVVEDMTVKKLPQKSLDLIIMYLKIAQEALKVIPPGTPIDTARKMIIDTVFNSLPDTIKPLIRPSNEYRILLKPNDNGTYSYKTNLNVILEKLKDVDQLCEQPTDGCYKGPSCFIYGELSPLQLINDQELIKGFFPKAQFAGVKDAFHGVHSDNPVDFTKALLEFLKE